MGDPKLKKTFRTQPALRLRVRCEKDHKDPWLRRLYVIWCAAPTEGEAAPAQPVFFLGQTSVEGKTRTYKGSTGGGYLAPLASDDDPSLTNALPQLPDVSYWFYFVRHPGADLPEEILKQLNGNFEAAQRTLGKPHALTPKLKNVGKAKELVLKVPEDPAYFLPRGSALYDGWVLFRDMPGTGANQRAQDIQCEVLTELVTRLQFHLGRMRYLVGVSDNPYLPSPTDRYNLGILDTITWSSVIRWQRDAEKGTAAKLKRAPDRTLDEAFKPAFALSKGSFKWARTAELRRSLDFVESEPANKGEATCSGAAKHLGVVGETAGDGIRKWVSSNFRKSGRILVKCPDTQDWAVWIADDLYTVVNALDLLLKVLGCPGFGANSTFRDARIGAKTAGGGSIVQSIHKSGLAMDLAMAAYVGPRTRAKAFELYFGPHPASQYPTKSMKWTVWAKLDAGKAPKLTVETMEGMLARVFEGPEFASVPATLKDAKKIAPLVEYASGISAWRYDGAHERGGVQYPVVEPDKWFLNLSKLVTPPSPFMLQPINAHTAGWQALPEKTVIVKDKDDYGRVMWRLGKQKSGTFTIDGKQYSGDALKAFVKRHASWSKVLGVHGAAPTMRVSPATKPGQDIINKLRKKKDLRGEILIEADASDAHELALPEPAARAYNELTGRVKISQGDLGRKTEFPKFDFYVTPVTEPLIKSGATFKFPMVAGDPSHMEWWHFQWFSGYDGKKWSELVKEIGWTDEGLGWCKDGVYEFPVYGQVGLGYASKGRDDPAG